MTKEDLILDELSKLNSRIDALEESLNDAISYLSAMESSLSMMEASLDNVSDEVGLISSDVSDIGSFF